MVTLRVRARAEAAAFVLLAAALPGFSAVLAKSGPPVDPVFDEVASFLAGRPCASSPYREYQQAEEYRAFAASLDASWEKLRAGRLDPIRAWARSEIGEAVAATATLFYPFGGPDALTALVLFPNAVRYVLLGLEFPGRLPVFAADQPDLAARYLQDLRASLDDFFDKSYFITRNMNEELAPDKVDGILPLLCFFLKRSGNAISSVTRLELTEGGWTLESPYPGEAKKRRRPFGVRIAFFAEGTDDLKELVYLSCDLEDKAFRAETPLSLFLQALPFETTFLKSASYLLHYREFSRIRGLILDRSRFVLQDDTGIPYRHFSPGKWDIRLYGAYADPVPDFSGVDQDDLREAYADPAAVRPLPFRLGYHWGTSKGSLLYLVKK